MTHSQGAPVPRQCEWCGVTFFSYAAAIKRGGGRFCSRAHSGEARRRKTPKLCQIPDCGNPAHLRRRWCSSHAHRSQRYGDPLAGGAYRTRKRGEPCDICGDPSVGRGLCANCHSRFLRWGEPTAITRRQNGCADEVVTCVVCGTEKKRKRYYREAGRPSIFCSTRCVTFIFGAIGTKNAIPVREWDDHLRGAIIELAKEIRANMEEYERIRGN